MMKKVFSAGRFVWAGALVGIALAVSGCSEARKTFGFERTVPDEFAVVSRAPLTMPPDYALKPPRPGASRPQEMAMRNQAASTLLGSTPASSGERSGSEDVLLQKAGAGRADADIRQKVDRESALMTAASKSFVDDLLFWKKDRPQGTVVNPRQEADRLKSNRVEGKTVTEGDTPMIIRKKSTVESLF